MTARSRRPTTGECLRAPADRPGGLPRRSAFWFRRFQDYGRRYVARHFHAVRVARDGPPPEVPDGPLIVVLNHPSWWDPMIGLVLAAHWPDRAHFAPIDAEALNRYRFFERLGFFGIEPGTARGGRTFLRTGLEIARRPGAALWLTAQGRFADPRERPTRIRPGVGHLVARLERASVVPLALEYPFWTESKPEALARFGPILAADGAGRRDEWTARIAAALEATQDALAADSARCDPSAFEVVLGGRAGVGGVYDLWRRLRAAARFRRFRPEHGGSPSRNEPAETPDR